MDDDVLGVTSVDDELFVLLERDENQVAVYDINDYQLLRHLNVPGFEPNADSDMTSCVCRGPKRYKICLYMSESGYFNSYIHRYDLTSGGPNATSKWSVRGKPCGLSVTPRYTLLVTCRYWGEPDKLVELRADNGEFVREIELQRDTQYVQHSIQLINYQFVVSHGDYFRDLHQVNVVGDDGEVTDSYGGQHGSDKGQLARPHHLALDKNGQFIFVADKRNDRVVLLSPTFQFVRYVIEELKHPQRLYFHQATRRLFVGHRHGWGGSVTVIQLSE